MGRGSLSGAVVAAGLLLLSAVAPALADVPAAQPLAGSTPYNAAYWSRPHNTYEKAHFAKLTDALDRGNQVVEIDIYDASGFPVKHNPGEADTANNCKGGAGGLLQDCLRDIKAWSDAHPGHLPITVQFDLKPTTGLFGWGASYMSGLNNLVISEFGAKAYKPEDLRGFTGYASLREGVFRAGWPSVDSLRGRIIVQMMGGPIGDKNDTQEEYVNQFGAAAQIFVCPEAHEPNDFYWNGNANDFDDANTNKWVVCGNHEAVQYWYKDTLTAQQNGQLVNLWSSNETQFDAFQQMYLAVAWGASMISHESLETWGGKLPLNGVRRSVAGGFSLRSASSGFCVEIQSGLYANGSDLNQRSCTGAVPQQWVYSDETQLRSVGNSAYCFDIEGGNGNNGDKLHIWNCDGGSSEKWQLQTDGRLIGMNGRCADVVDNTVGTRLQIRNCSGAASQRFDIVTSPNANNPHF
ncbi:MULTISPECIES: Ca2+-dependent phosphoinositide-specific phospholipase C [unclassified Inquilinus]|uniref:Ca2+-dependent phosphoinositide-specific phospholipase C n=1 Tax=unclassified Inquilinus TaxID=2645927 RepID=UPI003F8E1467